MPGWPFVVGACWYEDSRNGWLPGTSNAEVGWPCDGAMGRGNCGPSIGGGELTRRRWLRLERRGFSFGCKRSVSDPAEVADQQIVLDIVPLVVPHCFLRSLRHRRQGIRQHCSRSSSAALPMPQANMRARDAFYGCPGEDELCGDVWRHCLRPPRSGDV